MQSWATSRFTKRKGECRCCGDKFNSKLPQKNLPAENDVLYDMIQAILENRAGIGFKFVGKFVSTRIISKCLCMVVRSIP